MAHESTDWAYWPEIYLPTMHKWEVEIENAEPTIAADWDAKGDYFNISGVAPNVNFSMINFFLDLYLGPEASGPVLLSADWMPVSHIFYQAFVVSYGFGTPLLPVGDLPDNPFHHLHAMGRGYYAWQRLYLHLAMQVEKLTVFGKRGHP